MVSVTLSLPVYSYSVAIIIGCKDCRVNSQARESRWQKLAARAWWGDRRRDIYYLIRQQDVMGGRADGHTARSGEHDK